MNWDTLEPMQWKIGTLKNLVKKSLLCSDQHLLQKEVDYLRKVFVKKTITHLRRLET